MFQNLYLPREGYLVLIKDDGDWYFIRHNTFLEDQKR